MLGTLGAFIRCENRYNFRMGGDPTLVASVMCACPTACRKMCTTARPTQRKLVAPTGSGSLWAHVGHRNASECWLDAPGIDEPAASPATAVAPPVDCFPTASDPPAPLRTRTPLPLDCGRALGGWVGGSCAGAHACLFVSALIQYAAHGLHEQVWPPDQSCTSQTAPILASCMQRCEDRRAREPHFICSVHCRPCDRVTLVSLIRCLC